MLIGSMYNERVVEQLYTLPEYRPGTIANWQVTNWSLNFCF